MFSQQPIKRPFIFQHVLI